LSFIHSRKAINEIINNSYISDGEYRTNAIELLENLLNPKDVRLIISQIEFIFEYQTGTKDDTWHSQDTEIVNDIIENANRDYSSWIVANALRLSVQHNLNVTISDDLQKSDILVIAQELKRINHSN
jgi:hypothetical protein